jgi:RNA polymerase sigma-70 factor (ECF subfamily)
MSAHSGRLGRFFTFRTRDDDIARELVTETFFRAWRSRHSFRGEAKVSTWLWTIAHRVLIHHYKQRARRAPEILTDTLPDTPPDTPPEPPPEADNLQQRAVLECMAQLTPHIQRTAELVWMLGHSFVEAAELLSESPDTVRMRLKRARKPLQDCLARKGIIGLNST